MNIFWIIVIVLLAWTCGAIAHEKDLSRNYNKTGNACAWFFDIKR